MRDRFPNDFDLWCCFDGSKEDLTIRLFYEEPLAVKRISWRREKWHVSRL
jgi:hypothetical protein